MATQETVTSLIMAHVGPLKKTIDELTQRLQVLTSRNSVEEYTQQAISDSIKCEETLDVVKSIPLFEGKESTYVSWREAAVNSMHLYVRGSRRYYAALSILRNKIVGDANDVLTNHGTVLNMDAILSRLDFAYADKRPLHLIEQELSVMRQGSLSIVEYYNQVNKKLTSLINKTIMTHGSDTGLTRELNNKNRQYALRVFITGLNAPLADILFSLSPSDLPNALAGAQELESNNIRANFARQFNNTNNTNNRGFTINNQINRNIHNPRNYRDNRHNNRLRVGNVRTGMIGNNSNIPGPEPMEVDGSTNIVHRYPPKVIANRNHYNLQRPFYNYSHQNPVSNFQASKRPLSSSGQHGHQPQMKAQRINNIEESAFLGTAPDCPTLSNREHPDEDIRY